MRTLLVIAVLGAAVGAGGMPTDGAGGSAVGVASELLTAIEHHRAIEARGGWPTVPEGPTLHPGDRSPIVRSLATRLAVTGDLDRAPASSALPAPPPDLYDGRLVAAVRAFQTRHGLAIDGVVGRRTLAALNVPVTERIRQLELAAERMRTRIAPPARRWVRVNIPAYWLEVVDDGRVVLEMPVVVGRPDRATPEFTSNMNFLVLNPPWTIPTRLAYEDVLPKVRHDPDYLTDQGIHVYAGWRGDAEEIDPEWIDWRMIGSSIKGLKLRQAPGPTNPLGRIKFHMVNAFDVYLHDTSSRGVLGRAERAVSAGCVRVGDARALAAAVLGDHPEWPAERFDEALASGGTMRVPLPEPVPVQLYYQTAWVAADGRTHFREDVYRHDQGFATERARAARETSLALDAGGAAAGDPTRRD